MYKTVLIDEDKTQPSVEKAVEKAEVVTVKPKKNDLAERALTDANSMLWKYLGEHKKSILLVVRYTNATYLPDQQLNFLTSVLTACKLGVADVAIFNMSNAPSAVYNTIYDQFKSRVTVLFGITPDEFGMPVNFPEFQVQGFNNCTFLHTPILEELEADKVLKSKLWVCLRRIFDLS